jgi:hypothetical protein
MERLDGNAIGGLLAEVFGREMTLAEATCGSCGTRGVVAEVHVYERAPGAVARCPNCEAVLLVVVERRGQFCVDLGGVAALDLV